MKCSLCFVFTLALLLTNTLGAQSETLTVSDGSGDPGDTVTLTVLLGDNLDGVAGAAFTLDYDTSALSLAAVRSSFFPLFSMQEGNLPNSVEVDSVVYDKALVVNNAGTMIAAARVDNGPTGATAQDIQTLFELDFTINTGAATGSYEIEIIPSIISNADAGYSSPTEIPILVGISGYGLSYPERAVTLPTTKGTLTVNAATTDSDGDGIDDDWEMAHFNNLTTADATSDYDHDGYTDLVEFQNDGTNDPFGTAFNPAVMNAPGGIGYAYAKRDFDGDGKSDILFRRSPDGLVYMYFMDGLNRHSHGGPGSMNYDVYKIMGTPDLNGDGKADLLWRRNTDGFVFMWLMDGPNRGATQGLGIIPETFEIKDVADFDGDGKDDILFRRTTDGLVYIYFMDGLNRVSHGGPGSIDYDAYKIMGTPDLNGDGKADLLWKRPSDGFVFMWLMDGPDRGDTQGLGLIPETMEIQ